MLTTDLFDEDIRSIPSCFMDEQEPGGKPVWLPYELG